jgi:VWFA-related protein
MFFMRPLASLLCLIGLLPGQTPDAVTFRSAVTQVRVDVLASNNRGPVANLTRDDFEVLDEGQPVRFNSFDQEKANLQILLLLDVSGSMRSFLEQIGRRAQSLLSSLREGDLAGVMIFTKETDYLMPFSGNMGRVASAIEQALRPGLMPSGTSINAALADAAAAFREKPNLTARRAIFILTDNKGLNYRVPDDEVLRQLFGADTVLNAIVTNNAEPPKPARVKAVVNPDFSWADVFRLSAETGGEVLRTGRADEALARLLDNMRQRYLLTYDAPAAPPGQFRRITVSLTPAARKRLGNVQLRARRGYYTGS